MKSRTFLVATLFVSLLGCGQSQKISKPKTEPERRTETTADSALPNVRSDDLELGMQRAVPALQTELRSVHVELGMQKGTVSARLKELGARDVSSGMQVAKGAPVSDWMWALDLPKISIETRFENDKLATINVWDWRFRKQTGYHHAMRYEQVDSLTIRSNGFFDRNVIRIHNAAKN